MARIWRPFQELFIVSDFSRGNPAFQCSKTLSHVATSTERSVRNCKYLPKRQTQEQKYDSLFGFYPVKKNLVDISENYNKVTHSCRNTLLKNKCSKGGWSLTACKWRVLISEELLQHVTPEEPLQTSRKQRICKAHFKLKLSVWISQLVQHFSLCKESQEQNSRVSG